MSEERDDQVLLYARWLIWVFCLDDHIESRTAPQAVDTLFTGLLHRTGAPGAPAGPPGGPEHPIVTALAGLWRQTSHGMTSDWIGRFHRHLREQYTGCLNEHHLRRTNTVPTVAEYPLLRRRSSGLWLYDLPEAILCVELPPAFAATALWQELIRHISDAANWCNDILSCPKEATDGLTVNYLLVARHHLGLTAPAAVHWLTARITDRLDRAAALGRRIPATAARLGLPPATVRAVSRVACAALNFPAAYLTWALCSARYTRDLSVNTPAASSADPWTTAPGTMGPPSG
ncbi:Terpene synthase family protein (plasmid) [Streptomyces clavuligerus]|uniref:Terpene synthase n=7 Tax=Streptomyces clavuligerus TaxID=1901 RepID=D5SJG7_STRCL|nr:Terpene synthase family protein [Streptomyces clavuligerus]